MNYLDGFSGYGGFHLALEQAGWKFDNCYFSEIDKHAIANYSYNFPKSIYAGSIDTICKSGIITDLDLFTFGWPCQDNSIAGKREGQQSGTRSGLLYEAVNIIDRFKPRNFIAENVAGLLSVNKGIDIIESFKILSYLNESMPQYDIEMQLLNTRWFLPQNRERLFFVGHLRGSGSRQIFPIGENFTGLNERPANASIVRCFTAGGHSGGMHSGMKLIKSATKSGYEIADTGDSINLAVPNSKTRRGRVGKGVAQTLDTSCNQGVIQIGTLRAHRDGNGFREISESICPTIPAIAREDGSGQPIVRVNQINKSKVRPAQIGKSEKFQATSKMVGEINQRAFTIRSCEPNGVEVNSCIRRLTPLECERLQGLPDNWTRFGNYDGQIKEISDTQRYRLCGNGVSIPPVKAIAERLKH